MPTFHNHLRVIAEDACASFSDVTWKKMFGCDAAFANGQIFLLIWKTGRIGIKITSPLEFQMLLKLPGAQPWTIRDKNMSHWILVPEEFHDNTEELEKWVNLAHLLAAQALPKQSSKKLSKKIVRA